MALKSSNPQEGPLDLWQYKKEHENFPQETTADQFFDEAQWGRATASWAS